MLRRRILGLLIFSPGKQTLDPIQCFRMVAVIDPRHLALTSPVSGRKMIDLQMAVGITPCLVVNNLVGLFTGSHRVEYNRDLIPNTPWRSEDDFP